MDASLLANALSCCLRADVRAGMRDCMLVCLRGIEFACLLTGMLKYLRSGVLALRLACVLL
jgi:hypothetical protein